MDDRTYALAEAIAQTQWELKVEDEQSKTDFEVHAPDWADLGDHQKYLIHEARPLARAATRVLAPEINHLQTKVDRIQEVRDELYLAATAHGPEISSGVRKVLDKIDGALEDRLS